MSPEVQRYIPIVASALGGVAWFSYLTWAIQKERLAKRPVLLAASILGAIPALYMALVWTRLIPERYLRLERPLLALPCAIAVAFVAHRLLRLPGRQSRLRRTVTELLVTLA